MKKSLKIVSIMMMAIMMIMVATPVFANSINVEDIIDKTKPTSVDTSSVQGLIGKILGFLQWGAIAGGVLIITILGIKYMMGSLEEKAEYKKSMIPLIVGIIVVMGASTIANVLFKTFNLTSGA